MMITGATVVGSHRQGLEKKNAGMDLLPPRGGVPPALRGALLNMRSWAKEKGYQLAPSQLQGRTCSNPPPPGQRG